MDVVLTERQFALCSVRQAAKLCGLKGNTNGQHLFFRVPTKKNIENLTRWFDGNRAAAVKAIFLRHKLWKEYQSATAEERAAIDKLRKKVQLEVRLLLLEADYEYNQSKVINEV